MITVFPFLFSLSLFPSKPSLTQKPLVMSHTSPSLLSPLLLVVLLSTLLLLDPTEASTKVYQYRENVPLYSNKVGPFHNPDETFPYYEQEQLFCQPIKHDLKDQNLGEHLQGDIKSVSAFSLLFGESFEGRTACELNLTQKDLTKLRDFIKRKFYYEFVYDDIPLHGYVGRHDSVLSFSGELDESEYLYTHLHFKILYNPSEGQNGGGTVVYVNVTSTPEDAVLLTDSVGSIPFKYSASWVAVNTPSNDRSDVYHEHFFAQTNMSDELEIHWLAIINSCVLVLLLSGFVSIILIRILRSDLARYAEEDEDEEDDYGWKMVAHDVFRPPRYLVLFSSFIGVGAQFTVMTVFTLILALVGLYYPGNDGAMIVSSVVLYALTSAFSGFVSNYYYQQLNGVKWTWTTITTASVFALPFILMAIFVNFVANYHSVTKALPFTAILTVLTIWAFVGLPLTLLGAMVGKRYASGFNPPVKTKHFSRQLPPVLWYRTSTPQIVVAGFLPFSAIYIELHYIFGSLWGRGTYQLWGILIIVFLILYLVVSLTTVALVYFHLSSENYHWWWPSFMWGGSVGVYIFGYSVYYWYGLSEMTGFLQGSFYFGYQLFICYFFFLMLGTVGFVSSLTFVRKIYSNLHMD
eukprot:TRINITY_DN12316_c0_g1_i1.p1 TRINITY_DN12316_c0_g1~~TRINITY_DN12316_c0_g1_i1.p1  ORF type:complete len:633 (+),score=152.94 TRINITY_DN12316_c0_g1_i1:43-1941(+)